MSPPDSPRWRERANGFFTSSGFKLKQASQSVGEAAKDAGDSVAEAVEKVGSLVKSRWAFIQQNKQKILPPSKENFQDQIRSAASVTTTLLKKGIEETKDAVALGKVKVEEVAKKTSDKSKNLLSNIERWQKGVASSDVFGAPIEVLVLRQQSDRLIPQVLIRCADYLVLSGLNTEKLFKNDGDRKSIRQLISLYNQDWNAPLPEGSSPLDVAALIKCYLASLPEPLTTFQHYNEIRNARSNINDVIIILSKLPNVNYTTLEYVTALLQRVSQKSSLNKMDARSLAAELAPFLIWGEGDCKAESHGYLSYTSRGPSKTVDLVESPTNTANTFNTVSEDFGSGMSTLIPLDEGAGPDYGAIEAIQCLIEHHNAVFTDANETVWR